jgi:hypothetical protein
VAGLVGEQLGRLRLDPLEPPDQHPDDAGCRQQQQQGAKIGLPVGPVGDGAVVAAGGGKRLDQAVERRINPLLVDLLSLGEVPFGQQLELVVDRGMVDAVRIADRSGDRAGRVRGPQLS